MKSKLEPLKKELSSNNFKLRYNNYLDFYISQWQKNNRINIYYVTYRVFFALIFLATLIISVIDLDNSYQTAWKRTKWLIYITNWHFSNCTLQATLSACMVLYMYINVRRYGDYMQISYVNSIICNLYWILHMIAINGAVLVSIVYWNFVYNPSTDPLNIVNLSTHAFNAVLMVIDCFVIGHSIRLLHFYIPFLFNTAWVGFSLTYYLLGGTDKNDRPFIYNIVNWQRPAYTFRNLFFITVVIISLHFIIFLFVLLRKRIAKCSRRHGEREQASYPLKTTNNVIMNNDDNNYSKV